MSIVEMYFKVSRPGPKSLQLLSPQIRLCVCSPHPDPETAPTNYRIIEYSAYEFVRSHFALRLTHLEG